MNNYEPLNHSRWECKYHIVFIPKCRRKVLYGELRRYLGDVLHELAQHRGSKIEEGHLKSDHVHILISIPPKYSVSQVVGYLKGKSAIHVARNYAGKQRNFSGRNSGQGDILYRQWVAMRKQFVPTSRIRRSLIEKRISSNCFNSGRPL